MSGQTKEGQHAPVAPFTLFGNAIGGALAGAIINTMTRMDYYLRLGTVLHSTPGFYGYLVELNDGTCVSCVPPDSGPSPVYGLGATENSVISPGSEVVVALSRSCSDGGVIVCVYDNQVAEDGELLFTKTDAKAGYSSKKKRPYVGEVVQKLGTPSVGLYKSDDTFPGDWGIYNELGSGYFLGRSRLTLRGSDMSRVDMFPINDQMRVAAGYFQMYTHGGKLAIFSDNGGYTEWEQTFSPYVWETGGCKTASDFSSKIEESVDPDKQLPALKNPDMARYREYLGSIAGGKQIFTSCPNDKGDKNVGLSHIAISDSGALVFRSVSDIIFSQTNRIDVPIRVTDPEKHGKKTQPKITGKDETPLTAKWWLYNTGRRTASNTISQLYKRFKENEDWRVDSVDVIKDFKNPYDTNSGSQANINEKTAQLIIGQDGSITLSTSSGAEIKLSGKDITISCPGKLRFQAGEEVAIVSSGDAFVKSKRNCEVHAKKHLTLASEGRVSTFALHSVFFEVGEAKDSKDEEGAFAVDNFATTKKVRGIYFRANEKDMPVTVDSEYINFHPRRAIAVDATDKNGNIDDGILFSVKAGKIVESGRTCSYGAVDASGEVVNAGLMLTSSSGCLFGKNAMVAGDSGASLTSSSSMAVMLPAGGGSSYSGYSDMAGNLAKMVDEYFKILTKLEDVPHFSYRKKYTDIRGNAPSLIESPWTNIYKINPEWGKEKVINSTIPWPGTGSHVKTYRQDQSKLVAIDDILGDKKKQKEDKPEEESVEFEKYRG